MKSEDVTDVINRGENKAEYLSLLMPWVAGCLSCSVFEITAESIAGDASPRRYFRFRGNPLNDTTYGSSVIAAWSPPTEKNFEFLLIRDKLSNLGIRVPQVYAKDLEKGFFLIEDFGDELLSSRLVNGHRGGHYDGCFTILLKLVEADFQDEHLTHYNQAKLQEELDLFEHWFLAGLLKNSCCSNERHILTTLFEYLIEEALDQPTALVHRDFHSRNLMYLKSGELGVIDFQDAVIGPFTYDLVSLLKDCYVRWSRQHQLAWLSRYLEKLRRTGFSQDINERQIIRWFDLMGLQRHLKVLGVFSRLYLRDNKSNYLANLPTVIFYVREVLGVYSQSDPTLHLFEEWFDSRVANVLPNHTWWRSS